MPILFSTHFTGHVHLIPVVGNSITEPHPLPPPPPTRPVVGKKALMGEQAGERDKGIATLRAQNGEMASSSRRREVLAEHYREPGTPPTNERFDAEFEREANE